MHTARPGILGTCIPVFAVKTENEKVEVCVKRDTGRGLSNLCGRKS